MWKLIIRSGHKSVQFMAVELSWPVPICNLIVWLVKIRATSNYDDILIMNSEAIFKTGSQNLLDM